MTDHDAAPEPPRHDGLTEAEMDRQRLGSGLGDTVDGKDVADTGRPGPPPAHSQIRPPGTTPAPGDRADAGEIEDSEPGEGGPDGIEGQDTTRSGSSGT